MSAILYMNAEFVGISSEVLQILFPTKEYIVVRNSKLHFIHILIITTLWYVLNICFIVVQQLKYCYKSKFLNNPHKRLFSNWLLFL